MKMSKTDSFNINKAGEDRESSSSCSSSLAAVTLPKQEEDCWVWPNSYDQIVSGSTNSNQESDQKKITPSPSSNPATLASSTNAVS